MKSNIIVDIEKIKHPYCGLGQYSIHLTKNILKQTEESEIKFYAPDKAREFFPDLKFFIQKSFHRHLRFFIPSAKVWHALHQDSPYIPKKGKLVLTIHDLNFLYEKDGDTTERLRDVQKKIDMADHIVFISKFTENDVRTNLNLEGKKTSVVYNGLTMESYENPKRPNFAPDKKFLFSIGTILPKKNFKVLVGMLEKLPEYQLVLAGTQYHSYFTEIKDEIKERGIEDQFILPSEITDEEKYWCYENCEAFVYPSLVEGFGLPVVEALSLGKPTFTTTRTSLPEVGGSAAFYFEDFDPESMVRVFQDGMKSFTEEKRQECIKHARKFSWEDTAKRYIEIYRELANG